ncbi:uncharacterized protein LOC130988529 [Salvia miltiorrhiza]|nr:uncharacterized protein LOC130988529 [Salvia miltiorrhiza]
MEEIRTALMMRQVKKLHDMAVVSDRLCPMINKKLEKMKFQSRNMNTIPALGDKFEVDDEGEKYVVNIPQRTCTCRVWELTGIPCTHGLAAIKYLNDDASNFVHEYYTISKYLQAYKYALEPLNGPLHWPQCEGSVIKPPTVKNMPGRPKKNRIRDPHEVDPKNPNRLKRKGLVMTCGNCGERGHNTRGCKKEKVEKPTKEKGAKGRPKKNEATTKDKGKMPVISKAEQKQIAMEKAIAMRGAGLYISEGSGNQYFRTPDQRGVTHTTHGGESGGRGRGRPRGGARGRARGGARGSARGGAAGSVASNLPSGSTLLECSATQESINK